MPRKRRSERALKRSLRRFTNTASDPVEIDIDVNEDEDQQLRTRVNTGSGKKRQQPTLRTKKNTTEGSNSATVKPKQQSSLRSKRETTEASSSRSLRTKKGSRKQKQQSSVSAKRQKTERSNSASIHSNDDDVPENTDDVIYEAAFIEEPNSSETSSDDNDFIVKPPANVFSKSSKGAPSGSNQKGKEKLVDEDVTDETTTDAEKQNVAATSVKKKRGRKKVIGDVLQSIRTRTSPRTISTAIKQLSSVQKTCVRKMGLGCLLDIDIDHMPGVLGYYIVDNLDTSSMSIKMKHGVLRFNKEGINRVFKLPSTGNLMEKCVDQSLIVSESQWWSQYHKSLNVSTNDIVERLSTNKFADWLFKVDFSMLFLTSMIECSSNGRCIKAYIPFFKEDMDFSTIDWCGLIVNCMKHCTDKWIRNKKEKNYLGPLPIMIIYYVSSLRCEDIPATIYHFGFKGWSSKTLLERQEYELAGGGFGLFELVGCDSVTTKDVNAGDETNKTDTSQASKQINEDGAFNHADEPRDIKDTLSKMKEMLEIVKRGCDNFTKFYKKSVEKYSFDLELMSVYNEFKETIQVHCDCALNLSSDDDTPGEDGIESDEAAAYQSDDVNVTDNTDELQHADDDASNNDNNIDQDYETQKNDESVLDESQFWKDPDVVKEVFDTVDRASSTTSNSLELIVHPGIKVADEVPSFSLGLTQEFAEAVLKTPIMTASKNTFFNSPVPEPSFDLANSSRGKEIVKSRGVRTKKPGLFYRSPYMERPINVQSRTTKIETDVWKLIFDCICDDRESLFWGQNGTIGIKWAFESLANKTFVQKAVISCFAVVCNLGESIRSSSSPHRAFLDPLVMNQGHLGFKDVSLSEGLTMLRRNIIGTLGSDREVQNLKSYDILFLPLLCVDQYILLCFDIKNHSIIVLDGLNRNYIKTVSTEGDNQMVDYVEVFKNAVEKVKAWFVEYLTGWGHPKTNGIASASAIWLQTKCSTKTIEDSGTLVMRHMETYKGGVTCGCGVITDPAKQEKDLLNMRIKYLAKILLDDSNRLKGKIKGMMEFAVYK